MQSQEDDKEKREGIATERFDNKTKNLCSLRCFF